MPTTNPESELDDLTKATPTRDPAIVEVPTSLGPIRRFLDDDLHSQIMEATNKLKDDSHGAVVPYVTIKDGQPEFGAAYLGKGKFNGGEVRWSVVVRKPWAAKWEAQAGAVIEW